MRQEGKPPIFKDDNTYVLQIGPSYDRSRALRFFESGLFVLKNVRRVIFSNTVRARYENGELYDRVVVEVRGGGREFTVTLFGRQFVAFENMLSAWAKQSGGSLTAADWTRAYLTADVWMTHKRNKFLESR